MEIEPPLSLPGQPFPCTGVETSALTFQPSPDLNLENWSQTDYLTLGTLILRVQLHLG